MDAYIGEHRLRGLSPSTIAWRLNALQMFLRFHADAGLRCSPADCPPDHVAGFLHWMRHRKVKPVTVDDYFRVLRAFFNWTVRQGLRSDNPALQIPKPRADAVVPRAVTAEHFAAVLRALDRDDFATLRNRALFLFAFDTGCRASEICRLRVGDVDLLNRSAIVYGKGGRERTVYFGQTTAAAIVRYLTKRRLSFGDFDDDAYLFVSVDDGKTPLNRNAVLLCWRRAQRKAGVPVLPFHALRHGFARAWLLGGGDAFSLQMLLGHRNIATTQRYVHLWATDLQKLHATYSPVDRLVREMGGRRRPLPRR